MPRATPKPGAKAERERLRREMLAAGQPIEAIAAEMRARFGFRRRDAFRHAHGWSQEQAAVEYNLAEGSGTAPMSGGRLSSYETWPHGGERPSPAVLVILSRVYRTSVTNLVDHEEEVSLYPPRDRHVLDALCAPPSADSTAPPTAPARAVGRTVTLRRVPGDHQPAALAVPGGDAPEDGSPLVIRSRERCESYGVDGNALERSAQESRQFVEAMSETNIDEALVEDLFDDLAGAAYAYTHQALDVVITELLRIRDRAFDLLLGRQQPRYTLDLQAIAGRACALLANACMDRGHHRAGLTHARSAWTLAKGAGDRRLMAWVRGIQSSITYWSGQPSEAARLAAMGASLTDSQPGGCGTTRVFLISLQARAFGALGDDEKTEEAAHAAANAREQAGQDEIGGVFAFPAAKQQLYLASAFLGLARPADAEPYAATAVTLYQAGSVEEWSYGDEAGARLDLATARILRRDLDGGIDSLARVLTLPPTMRVNTIHQRLDRVTTTLRQHYPAVPQAWEITAQVTDFQQAGTGSLYGT